MKKLFFFSLLTFFFLFFYSCSSGEKNEKEKLLFQGLKQSSEYSEKFLNFYYENNIERSSAEYPEYYADVAGKMRKIWKFYQNFDAIIGDSLKARDLSAKEIYFVYKKSIDSLNTMLPEKDCLFKVLKFNAELEKYKQLIIYRNNLENLKNKFLRKLINTQAKAIRQKHYYAFQVIEASINQTEKQVDIYFSYTENNPPFTNQIQIDSIINTKAKSQINYSIDSSLIFGKINISTNKSGNYLIYGKVKINGQNGSSLIPFKEKFEIY